VRNNVRLFVVSGFSDLERAGNQSLKATLKYLAEFGYEIELWSFMPEGYWNLAAARDVFAAYHKVRVHRLPKVLLRPMLAVKWLKDRFGRRAVTVGTEESVGVHDELRPLLRLFYIFYMFAIYLPIDLCRVGIHAFRRPPDLFYGVNWHGSFVASLLGRVFRRPVLTRFQGSVLQPEDFQQRSRLLLRLDEIAAMRAPAAAVVMTNDGSRGDAVLRLVGVPSDKIRFWMNGLDIDDLTLPADWDREAFRRKHRWEAASTLVMCSRLASWKRIDRGIACVAELVRRGRGDVRLIVIGDGPDLERLKSVAASMAVADRVLFLGGIPHRAIAAYMRSADAFLSLYDLSNLGNPLLEALYLGVPVVTLDDGSTAGILENGGNSLLVAKHSGAAGLADAVETLLDSPEERQRLTRNARATYEANVRSWRERMLLEDELIRSLIQGRGNHASDAVLSDHGTPEGVPRR
jgi:glycosyltransferase involved in cell wall biosynthesis